jgi:hypothetical protein
MDRVWLYPVLGLLLLLVFIMCYTAVIFLFRSFARTRRTIRLSGLKDHISSGTPPAWLMAVCWTGAGRQQAWAERRQLLAAAGIRINLLWYICLKRIAVFLCAAAASMLWLLQDSLAGMIRLHPAASIAVVMGFLTCILCDGYFLESLKRYRTNRIVEEIFTVSQQLLYFAGSPMHLHGKLSRCLSHTTLIRQDWHLLLNDWYQDAEGAIARFRQRLGTEEAHGFAETLQYMRLYDSDAYYGLLRQRVQDYKERLEMIRDSRKESASYVLFVVAAIPIMYTFQIFIYPWVQEGQRLFQSLN